MTAFLQQSLFACLEKAHKSNDDNTVIRHTDTNTPSHDVLGWNEPVDYNAIYSCIGMNSNIYITRTFYDNLTNFAGNGVEDPRADKFIPWARSAKSDATPAEIKWSEDGKWRRYDYDKEIFMNWDKPYFYKVTPSLLTYCPEGEAPCRWKQASYELNYNTKNLKAIGEQVPGAEKFGENWYNHNEICTLPVWWDSTQE